MRAAYGRAAPTTWLLCEPLAALAADAPAARSAVNVDEGRAHFRRGVEPTARASTTRRSQSSRARTRRRPAFVSCTTARRSRRSVTTTWRAMPSSVITSRRPVSASASHALARWAPRHASSYGAVRACRHQREDVRLFIDDRPAALPGRGEPLLLSAGIYLLRADKDGYVPAARTITLTGGDETSVGLELIAALDVDDTPPPLRPPSVAAPLPAPVDGANSGSASRRPACSLEQPSALACPPRRHDARRRASAPARAP